MSTAIATLETLARSSSSDGEQLGAEITKLCSYIYAAEARLLIMTTTVAWSSKHACRPSRAR